MRSPTLLVLVFITFFAIYLCQDDVCTRAGNTDGTIDECVVWTPDNSKQVRYCDTNTKTCQSKTSVTFKARWDNVANSFCDGSYKKTGIPAQPGAVQGTFCFASAKVGCTFTQAEYEEKSFQCQFHSTMTNQGNNYRCIRNNQFNFGIVNEGRTCQITKDNKIQKCGHNLRCNSGRQCEVAFDVDSECVEDADCRSGLLCNHRRCIFPYSVELGEACDTDKICKTGFCGTNKACEHSESNNKCFRDVDCKSSRGSVCFGATATEAGRCSAVSQPAARDYLDCVYHKCNDHVTDQYTQEDAEKCMTTGTCQNEYARAMCSKYCVRHPEERYALIEDSGFSFLNSGETTYVFNCEELTVASIPNNERCSLRTQFTKCEAVQNYKSGANSMVSFVPGIMILISFIGYMFMA